MAYTPYNGRVPGAVSYTINGGPPQPGNIWGAIQLGAPDRNPFAGGAPFPIEPNWQNILPNYAPKSYWDPSAPGWNTSNTPRGGGVVPGASEPSSPTQIYGQVQPGSSLANAIASRGNGTLNLPGAASQPSAIDPSLSSAIASNGNGQFHFPSPSPGGGGGGPTNVPTTVGAAAPATTSSPSTWSNRTTAEGLRRQQQHGTNKSGPQLVQSQPDSLSTSQVLEAEGVQPGASATPTTSGVVPGVPGAPGSPSMSASGNQNASTNPGDNSGSASLGALASSASESFDAGGVVPDADGPQPMGDLSAVMDKVNQTLEYGRQQHGLRTAMNTNNFRQSGNVEDDREQQMGDRPRNQSAVDNVKSIPGELSGWVVEHVNPSSTEDLSKQFQQNTQGMAEGGVVGLKSYDEGGAATEGDELPQPPQGPTQGGGTPRIASYVMGTDAVSPDVAQAMEARIDPQGQMDPTERKMRAIAAQQNPQQAWGLMQAYRQKFDRFRQFARAAAQGIPGKPADPAAAAHAATQAFQNVPDGKSVQFAPARGGVTATVKNLVGGKTKGYDDGGVVDTNTDAIPGDEAPDFSQGGSGGDVSSFLSLPNLANWLGSPSSTHDQVLKNGYSFPEDTLGGTENASPDTAQYDPRKFSLPSKGGLTTTPAGEGTGATKTMTEESEPDAAKASSIANAEGLPPNRQNSLGWDMGDAPGSKTQPGAAPEETDEQRAATDKRLESDTNRGKGYTPEDMKRWQQEAVKAFPWSSQAGQRQAYVEKRLEAAEGLIKAKNTRAIGAQATAEAREKVGMAGVAQRAAASKLKAAVDMLGQDKRFASSQEYANAKLIAAGLATNTDPTAALQKLQQVAPNVARTVMQQLQQEGVQPQQEQQGQQPQQYFRDKKTNQLWQLTPQGYIPFVQPGR